MVALSQGTIVARPCNQVKYYSEHRTRWRRARSSKIQEKEHLKTLQTKRTSPDYCDMRRTEKKTERGLILDAMPLKWVHLNVKFDRAH
jgi:hypothetical protein